MPRNFSCRRIEPDRRLHRDYFRYRPARYSCRLFQFVRPDQRRRGPFQRYSPGWSSTLTTAGHSRLTGRSGEQAGASRPARSRTESLGEDHVHIPDPPGDWRSQGNAHGGHPPARAHHSRSRGHRRPAGLCHGIPGHGRDRELPAPRVSRPGPACPGRSPDSNRDPHRIGGRHARLADHHDRCRRGAAHGHDGGTRGLGTSRPPARHRHGCPSRARRSAGDFAGGKCPRMFASWNRRRGRNDGSCWAWLPLLSLRSPRACWTAMRLDPHCHPGGIARRARRLPPLGH